MRKFRNDGGSVAVEAAIIFPGLVFIILILVGFGLVLNAYQSVTHAAHEGARYASLGMSAPDVDNRVEDTVGPLATVTSVALDGCDGSGSATVTVTATVTALVFDKTISSVGVEKCA